MIEKLFGLKGKTALVTGSSQSLGLVFAKALGEAGARVILNGRDKQKLEAAAEEVRQSGIEAYTACFDITKKEEVVAAIEKIDKEIGTIDILVNNAGIQRRTKLEDFPENDWDDLMATNLKGAFLVTQQVGRRMIEKKAGKIINIGSMQCELGRQNITPYATTKGGIQMFTRGTAVEWAKYNIQCNGIAPGYFITKMTKPLADDKQFSSWLCARTPANRWGLPEELIGALILLASNASSFINGQMIFVDGGILSSM